MFYTIYKITNIINGKIYIGKHQTKDLNDNYMGSGKHLRHSIAKYGIENFKKEILFQFDNEDEMNTKEAELVTEEFCLKEDTYNLCPGGRGGFGYIRNMETYFDQVKLGRVNADKEILRRYGVKNFAQTEEFKLENSKRTKLMWDQGKFDHVNHSTFLGKSHTDETKRIIGSKNSVHQSGNKNSQYGKRWIYSLEEKRSIRISKTDPIPNGWFEGRKIKF